MQCPFCDGDSQVSDSRATADHQIRRRRICTQCKRRFTTYERIGSPSLKVIKRSGKTEPFSTDKLATCLRRVTRYRPVMGDQLARLGRAIEAQLVDAGTSKITSGQILDQVLARLRDLDRVSFNRLAANYTDEAGRLRTDAPIGDGDADDQLDLFGADDE